jgi:transposase-like protein
MSSDSEPIGFSESELRRLEQLSADDIDARQTSELALSDAPCSDSTPFDPETRGLSQDECRAARVQLREDPNVSVSDIADAAGVADSTVRIHAYENHHKSCNHDLEVPRAPRHRSRRTTHEECASYREEVRTTDARPQDIANREETHAKSTIETHAYGECTCNVDEPSAGRPTEGEE